MEFPKNLTEKLLQREKENALRVLTNSNLPVDFSSNDYLCFAKSESIFSQTHEFLKSREIIQNGATGSRLISGNHELFEETENFIAQFHQSETSLIFNSGYDANVGFFSSVPQRSDFIFYDELCHASIRDGIGLSKAKAYKFGHNDLEELEKLIEKFKSETAEIYVVTESVFSMDGDAPNLEELVSSCEKNNCLLVIDEAHALGVFGENGCGRAQENGVSSKVFARIMTFGKGLGCHGAAILGSAELRNYLINFSRSLIYTTALPPHSIATILTAYKQLYSGSAEIAKLQNNIAHFNREKTRLGLKPLFIYSKSAIQSAVIPGNKKVKTIAAGLREKGFDVKAILSPTVQQGQERLRICLHSYNSETEISNLLEALTQKIFG